MIITKASMKLQCFIAKTSKITTDSKLPFNIGNSASNFWLNILTYTA